jgi:apolipoprotein N-acyltransferase
MSARGADVGDDPKQARGKTGYGLAVLSGIMLGFSFPPSRLGILACFGLVPLLVALAHAGRFRTTL